MMMASITCQVLTVHLRCTVCIRQLSNIFLSNNVVLLPAVSKPATLDLTSVRESLVQIVPLCLDSDPYLMPLSCGGIQEPSDSDSDAARNPDDFSFWSERQAKRICSAIK